jgi:hypothetical protein
MHWREAESNPFFLRQIGIHGLWIQKVIHDETVVKGTMKW